MANTHTSDKPMINIIYQVEKEDNNIHSSIHIKEFPSPGEILDALAADPTHNDAADEPFRNIFWDPPSAPRVIEPEQGDDRGDNKNHHTSTHKSSKSSSKPERTPEIDPVAKAAMQKRSRRRNLFGASPSTSDDDGSGHWTKIVANQDGTEKMYRTCPADDAGSGYISFSASESASGSSSSGSSKSHSHNHSCNHHKDPQKATKTKTCIDTHTTAKLKDDTSSSGRRTQMHLLRIQEREHTRDGNGMGVMPTVITPLRKDRKVVIVSGGVEIHASLGADGMPVVSSDSVREYVRGEYRHTRKTSGLSIFVEEKKLTEVAARNRRKGRSTPTATFTSLRDSGVRRSMAPRPNSRHGKNKRDEPEIEEPEDFDTARAEFSDDDDLEIVEIEEAPAPPAPGQQQRQQQGQQQQGQQAQRAAHESEHGGRRVHICKLCRQSCHGHCPARVERRAERHHQGLSHRDRPSTRGSKHENRHRRGFEADGSRSRKTALPASINPLKVLFSSSGREELREQIQKERERKERK
ncbi:hypothetical protein L228DRAFT_3032 [Xylona heveae TC161]|uniref:Uncharacterized protein n=1 Tax=Xylona heveae (strain CBS 132557 / TC161) TaxID=1328760 RepID=A0A165JBC5_XYLHT|nr:hypothetical protein L228DRAFT_3032 [Xylona heveae TC161]KZF26006.1 hypothetical protein L228DRAFT_3032 [Xylona heveae TC161]